ncbi:NAD(P)/FAD-dependent oxidoreductase [Albidovulum sediminicola]|uniref:NAD(P)/FAD-dependent oxidoreductase n=1 Tax=Albidovulum sediminicola TaxID=2984331 RepID=A0ABT2YXP3_9RHOB|nr:NAD(P)/FAD-dependent oxidoreductase [Defluviimonas sp. WL0075]MCV2863527.1 NAD(P)/FAD-dependent oxidoreductase [Defluviimonas sp. WL0075]
MRSCDVLVLGAGAAGLFAAGEAARRGRRVVVIDHAARPGEKIRISGGGRCNFTNFATGPDRFLSENPRFAVSALSRFTARDFVARIDAAGIAWHEKAAGQLFCDGSARQVTDMLVGGLREGGAELWLSTAVETVERGAEGFRVRTAQGEVAARAVIVATGGKSIPKMGATGLGYRIAQSFGLRVTETRPALVPLTFADQDLAGVRPMAGVSLPARIAVGKTAFDEPLLFTHRGLSGPGILQISSYWREGEEIEADLLPSTDLARALAALRGQSGRQALHTALAGFLPDKVAAWSVARAGLSGRLADQSNARLDQLAGAVHRWRIKPVGSEGYRTAEVTLGGVDTAALDARTMQARTVPGLYFIGEVVDVTGWLGGYNFQWAWSSAWAAGQAV